MSGLPGTVTGLVGKGLLEFGGVCLVAWAPVSVNEEGDCPLSLFAICCIGTAFIIKSRHIGAQRCPPVAPGISI